MIRVLHVISQLGLGGAQRAVLDMLAHSQRFGIESRLAVLYGTAIPSRYGPQCDRISFLAGRPGFRSPANLVRLSRALQGVVQAFPPDIVHSHLRPADMMVAASLSGCRALHFSHQQDTTAALAGNGPRPILKRKVARRLYRRMNTRLIFVSAAVERFFAETFGQCGGKSRIIHNAADESAFFPTVPPGRNASVELVFGTAARLAPEKGIDVLIRGFALLRQRTAQPLRLRIAGTGRCEGELRSLAAELELGTTVEFLGQIDDMRSFYNGIDLFVLPSRHSEGFPLSIVEAMFCGRPVIATRVAGADEAVGDGRTGMLVPQDDPVRLAEAMEAMARPEVLQRLGPQAEDDARARFGLEAMLLQVSDFYRLELAEVREPARMAANV